MSVNLNIQEARKTKASPAPMLCSTHVWLCSVTSEDAEDTEGYSASASLLKEHIFYPWSLLYDTVELLQSGENIGVIRL